MRSAATAVLLGCLIATGAKAQTRPPPAPQAVSPPLSAPAYPMPVAPQAAPAIDPNVVRVQISPERETSLMAPMSGRITSLAISLGSNFDNGKMLVAFECSENQARAMIADSELKGARESHDAKVRLQGLQAAGEVEVNLAAAAVERGVGQVQLARAQMAQCIVTAPFAGRAAKVHVKQHQGVTMGAPLADLISNGPLKVRLNAPSRWLKSLRIGTRFEVAVDETGRKYPARVSAIGARVDTAAQTIEIEGSFGSSFPELLAGMSGSAHFAGLQ